MKLLVQSDLHFEHDVAYEPWKRLHPAPQGDIDALVLAGDIASPELIDATLTWMCDIYPRVVYVPGNHEHWRRDPRRVYAQLDVLAARCPNLYVLGPRRTVTLGGLRFVGATGWGHPGARTLATAGLDFRFMDDPQSWMAATSEDNWSWLESAVGEADVVVTHTVPTIRGIASRYIGSVGNWYFCPERDDLVAACGAPLWICGHTHDPFDLQLGDTRVVCNPRGYPFESNLARGRFNADLIIDVEPRREKS